MARKRIFDGAAEAKLIALACSDPPKGRSRWTLKLLESAVVALNIVDRASDNTIGWTLKKTRSSRISRSSPHRPILTLHVNCMRSPGSLIICRADVRGLHFQ